MIDALPNSLKYEIQLERYYEAVHVSQFCKESGDLTKVDYSIVAFFFKKCKYEIFLPGEYILTAGS